MDCKSMQKSLKTTRLGVIFTDHPLKTACKSSNSKRTTIRFPVFFEKIKVEI